MVIRIDLKTLGTAAGMLLAASSLAAQTPDGQDKAVQDSFAASAGTQEEDAASTLEPSLSDKTSMAIAKCRAKNENLRAVIRQGVTVAVPANDTQAERLENKLEQCRQDERQNRITNQRLNNVLKEVREALAAAHTELEVANAEIAALTARLESLGVGTEPTFRYAGSVDSSYMRRDVADIDMPDDLKLSSDRCQEALAWLDTQTGTDLWLRKMVWVWNADSDVLLCAPTAAGNFEVKPASPSDEAHVIIFE